MYSSKCLESFICVNQDGKIFPCGRFADENINFLGDIFNGINNDGKKILEILKLSRNSGLNKKCRECKYKILCNGGCLRMQGAMCEDHKKFLDWLYSEGLKKYAAYLNKRRKEILCLMNSY